MTPPSSGLNPVQYLSRKGLHSHHAYTLGAASIGLSFAGWAASQMSRSPRAQSDRWGLFIGEWAPTLLALGVALKLEEN